MNDVVRLCICLLVGLLLVHNEHHFIDSKLVLYDCSRGRILISVLKNQE